LSGNHSRNLVGRFSRCTDCWISPSAKFTFSEVCD